MSWPFWVWLAPVLFCLATIVFPSNYVDQLWRERAWKALAFYVLGFVFWPIWVALVALQIIVEALLFLIGLLLAVVTERH